MSALPLLRRQNALALFHAFAEQALATGQAPKGLEQAFAASVQISPSLWSQIKSSRPIGDKLARQIEVHARQVPGWLDEPHEAAAPSPAAAAGESGFLTLLPARPAVSHGPAHGSRSRAAACAAHAGACT